MKIMKFAKIGTLRVFFTKQKHFGPLLIVIVSNNGNMTKVFHVNAIILRWRRKKTHLNDLLIALVKRFTGVTRNEKKCTQ